MVFDKLKKMISETLDIDEDLITMDAGLKDLDIDSLDVVEIIMDIEDEFQVEMPDEVVKKFKCIGDFVQYIEANK